MKNIISVTNDPIQIFNVNIDRILYTFKILYNARFDFWTLSLFKNDDPIFISFKLIQGVNIGEIFNPEFQGVLYIDSVSGDDSDPTLSDFGGDKRLIYDDLI